MSSGKDEYGTKDAAWTSVGLGAVYEEHGSPPTKYSSSIPRQNSRTSSIPLSEWSEEFQHLQTKRSLITTPPNYSLQILRAWSPELLASILGLIALLAIVIVLRINDGQAADALSVPNGLTLNGLLAMLGTFQRVFLMVVLGSTLSQEAWLWLASNATRPIPRSKLRDLSLSDAASRGVWGSLIVLFYSWRRWIALVGALVAVLSLAMDIFTQQLVTYTSMPMTDRVYSLTPGNIPWTDYYNNFYGNPAEAAFGTTLDVKAAAYSGFLATDISAIQSDCPTGNCTFPFTPSVAVCGQCETTTNHMTSCNSTICNYTTSTGSIFAMSNFNYTDMGTTFRSQSVLYQADNATADGNLTVADFEILGASYGSFSGSMYGSFPQWPSYRCRLWMCVNVYETSVSNGNQVQSIVESYRQIRQLGDSNGSVGGNWTFTMPEQWRGERFQVSEMAYMALSSQLSDMVSGSATSNLAGYATTSDTVQAVWKGTEDLQNWIQRVALSLTNVVRQDNPSTRSVFNGTASQLSVSVRWWWLTLPASLTALSVMLLLLVVTGTHRSNIGVWKGSPLTVLLFDIDRDLRQHIDDVDWNGLSSGIDSHLADKKVVLQRIHNGRFLLKGVETAELVH